ncbi:MAG: methyltransferase [Thiotrichaceae bacterium IS1]|nr:MAG: methyltransferase [Thiotrichaceae bacterium IS1]
MKKLAIGTGTSLVVEHCQVCDSPDLQSLLFLGYLPPVNQMRLIGERPKEQPAYPAELLYCPRCQLVQLGLIVDPQILFPPEYPYTSGTTRILRENFAEMYQECKTLIPLTPTDLIVDIGSNDGTLLSNFKNGGHRVQGIEPTQMGNLANERGIPTEIAFFGETAVNKVKNQHGLAKIITATNVFAHIEDIHAIVKNILNLLDNQGVFISESHYFASLVETLQYDTIYHEHLRYYSLQSLQYLLNMHGLEVIHAKRIPTHGGSIRVYAARHGTYPVQPTVKTMLEAETTGGLLTVDKLQAFKNRVIASKLELYALLADIKKRGQRIYGISAPSRASTLVNYVGLDDGLLDCVLEVPGSYKIGKYMPGTLIPVLEETKLFTDQPEYALILSWHIADELLPKLKQKGFKGDYIIPLPVPTVVKN